MKTLWNYIDKKNWKIESKFFAVLWLLGIIGALLGFGAWLIIRTWTLSTLDWMICFTGYPIVLSWFLVFFYSCNHDFHNGCPEKQKS